MIPWSRWLQTNGTNARDHQVWLRECTKTLVFQVINMGAVGGQRVLDNDRLQVRMFPAKIVHQPLCCIAFAVVFVSAVFFQDGFGGQRQNLFVLGWIIAAPSIWW